MTAPNTDLNYQTTTLVNPDVEHLKILTICWYVWSGLLAMGGFFPFIYIIMGAVVLADPHMHHAPEDTTIATVMICIGILISLFIWTLAFLSFFTAQSLRQRRRRMFCFVCSILACLNFPLGILLGIFTLIVISRQSVQQLFATTSQAGPA